SEKASSSKPRRSSLFLDSWPCPFCSHRQRRDSPSISGFLSSLLGSLVEIEFVWSLAHEQQQPSCVAFARRGSPVFREGHLSSWSYQSCGSLRLSSFRRYRRSYVRSSHRLLPHLLVQERGARQASWTLHLCWIPRRSFRVHD
ncbi:hypothetical protein BDY24DRAFT_445286, partial [Mrakia frigida]|uniref:uncharacterized protein n=1 Tax=Mrakia frigida TaxID=29902 RepID=UPI003FCBFEF0